MQIQCAVLLRCVIGHTGRTENLVRNDNGFFVKCLELREKQPDIGNCTFTVRVCFRYMIADLEGFKDHDDDTAGDIAEIVF